MTQGFSGRDAGGEPVVGIFVLPDAEVFMTSSGMVILRCVRERRLGWRGVFDCQAV